MVVLLFCCVLLSGCLTAAERFDHKTYGDFVYIVVQINDEGKIIARYSENKNCVESYINIIGLSEEGRTKEIVIVPQFIDGLETLQIGDKFFQNKGGSWKSRVLKKVYIPFHTNVEHFNGLGNDVKNIFLSDEYDQSHDGGQIYVSSYNSDYIYNYAGGGARFSNVSYMYNYNGALNNGYYWIDDYDYGTSITYKPENPIREGYTFGGWYKEIECINEWNFDVDKLPDAMFDEYNVELYQETILYAKWVEE